EAEAAKVRADQSSKRLGEELFAARIEQGRLLGQTGDVVSAERFLWDALLSRPDSTQARWALWELYSRTGCARTVLAHKRNALAVAVDPTRSDRIASAGDDGVVRLWSVADCQKLNEFKTELHEMRSVRFSPDGKFLVAGGEGGAAIFDSTTGDLLRALGSPELTVIYAVDVTPDSKTIATVGEDGIVRLWRSADGTLITQIASYPQDQASAGRK